MSLILDALARAERDKQRAASSLPELLQDAALETRSGRRGLWLAIAVLLVVIGVLAVLYFRALRPAPAENPVSPGNIAEVEAPMTPVPPAVPAAATGTSAGAARATGAAPPGDDAARRATGSAQRGATGSVAAGRSESTARGAAASVAALYSRGAAEPSPPGAATEAPDELAAARVQGAPDSRARESIDALPRSGDSATALARAEAAPSTPATEPLSAERIEEAVDIEAVLRDVRAEAAAGGLRPHRAPLLADLSQQFRDDVPTLMYLRHDFNPGGVSTVLLNGETLRVGGRTRGVEVREILADSTVLVFRGQEFRLRALNSWVNL